MRKIIILLTLSSLFPSIAASESAHKRSDEKQIFFTSDYDGTTHASLRALPSENKIIDFTIASDETALVKVPAQQSSFLLAVRYGSDKRLYYIDFIADKNDLVFDLPDLSQEIELSSEMDETEDL